MATWNSITWSERGQSGIMVQQHPSGALTQVRTYLTASGFIDRGGTTLPAFSMPIQSGSAAYSSLRSAVGEKHSLIYSGGTVDAFLASLHDGVIVKDGVDTYQAVLDFVPLTSSTTFQTLSAGVTVAGGTVSSAVLELTVSHGTEQNCGQATVVFPSRQGSLNTGDIVAVSIGVNGSLAAVFSGTATGRGWEYFPSGFAADCRDRQDRLNYPYGGTERTYTMTTGGSVEQNLIEAMGIASGNTHIEDDGNTIAVIQSIVFRQGDRFLPWIRENDEISGYVTYTKAADSAIYRTPYNYDGTIYASLTKGTNIISARRNETIDGMYNGVQVDGLTTSDFGSVSVFASTANSYIPSPPGTVTYRVQSNIIESEARGTIVANVLLPKLNIRQEEYSFTVPLRTDLEPTNSITVTHADLELSGGTVLLTKVEHRMADATGITTLTGRKLN